MSENKKRAFEVLVGTHSVSHGKISGTNKLKETEHPKGSIVYSVDDLCAKFPNKFREVAIQGGEAKAGDPAPAPVPPAPEPEEQAAAPVQDKAKSLGEDVTANFPAAEGTDFKVFVDANGGFWVADKDNPTKAAHRKPLKKNAVAGVINDLKD